jgi:ABC-type transport system substrate-binding protein
LSAAVLVAVLLLAACGGGAAAGQGSEGTVDPQGVLRIGTTLRGAGEPQFDPASTQINPDETWISLIYGTLMRPAVSGGYEPWLAESAEVVDPSTVRVTIREGITFSDGAVYDAEAVRTGILRNRDHPASQSVTASRHSLFRNLTDVVVDGPLQVSFRLDQPVAGEFLAVLAGREAAVPSPKAIAAGADLNAAPVGAGPYLLERFRPGQDIALRKNPGFVDAERWRIAEFDFVDTPTGPAGVTALLSGSVDMLINVTPTDAAGIERNDRYEVLRHFTDFSFYYMTFCSTKPPFDDVRIRQAFQRAMDRDKVNSLLLGGQGEPAYAFWRSNSPNSDPSLQGSIGYDADTARGLLAQAGAAALSVDLWYPSAVDGRLMEIVQGQLAEAGVTLNLHPSQDIISEFITPQKPGLTVLPGSRPGVDKINRIFQPTSVQNLCGAQHTDIAGLTAQIAAMAPDDPARIPLWQRIDRLNADGAFAVPLVWTPQIIGVDRNRVGGDIGFADSRQANVWTNYEPMFVKA